MKKLVLALFTVGFVLMGMMLKPVPVLTEKDCLVAEGRAAQIFEGPSYDIVIKLENNDTHFYINRGIEQGYSVEDLRTKFIGKRMTIKYPDYWTPLDHNESSRHISKIVVDVEVIFSEIG